MFSSLIRFRIWSVIFFSSFGIFLINHLPFPNSLLTVNLVEVNAIDFQAKNLIFSPEEGQVIDMFKGVEVYYNGDINNTFGISESSDGYYYGKKYLCEEFVNRFYFETHRHRMPDCHGEAKDYFDVALEDNVLNPARNMHQFYDDSTVKPRANDLVVLGKSKQYPRGHLFIITEVGKDYIRYIHQNPGIGEESRGVYELTNTDGNWKINVPHILGWLRV